MEGASELQPPDKVVESVCMEGASELAWSSPIQRTEPANFLSSQRVIALASAANTQSSQPLRFLDTVLYK